MSDKLDKIKNGALKEKKTAIICTAAVLILALIITVICVSVHNYRKVEEFEMETLQFSDYTENKKVKLIAHRGYRAIAPENTLPAYEMAGQAGYWGAECDVYRTKDGVWVLQHDPKTSKLMNKSKKIEKSSYEELKQLYYKRGNNIANYQELRICTLEEYLDKCSQFNMTPVIELKGKNNQEYYSEIVSSVSKYSLKAVYISFEKTDLEKMRELTDAKLFLLTSEVKKGAIKDAKSIKNCGLEFNAAEEKNYTDKAKELIKQAQKDGVETAAWNVNSIDTLNKLYKSGTYYYTTDMLTY